MTVEVDDPLIARMAIARTLPLHESSRRLRGLYPECPRVYGVAVMSDLTRRRWWPLAESLNTDRLHNMFEIAALEMDSPVAAAQQLAATLAHVVIGRVIPLVALEGRAWDTGLENLWVHVDSEGAIDWVGVVDPTLRALPDDPFFGDRAGRCRAVRPRRSRAPAKRSGVGDLGCPPQPPGPGAVVHPTLRHQRWGNLTGVDVAQRRGGRGGGRDARSVVGRVERDHQHAPRAGRARRARRFRAACARRIPAARGEGLAQLGQACLS